MKSVRLEDHLVALLLAQLGSAARRDLTLLPVVDVLRQDRLIFGKGTAALDRLAQAMAAQGTLGGAMAQVPGVFSAETAALVQAAEARGELAQTLSVLAEDYQRRSEGRIGLSSALGIPAALLGTAAVVTIVLLVFVVPAFKEVFNSFGAELPGPTLFFIAISDVFVAIAPFVLLAAVVAGVAWWRRKLPEHWRRALVSAPLALPALRRFVSFREVRRLVLWLQHFGDDLQMRRAALQHLEASTWSAVGHDIGQVRASLDKGAPLSEALGSVALFPAIVSAMARLGERSGMAESLAVLDEFAQNEEAVAYRRLRTSLTFWSYWVAGMTMGLLLLSLYLPIFKLGSIV
jgi:type IV pilus assembly protein PilC